MQDKSGALLSPRRAELMDQVEKKLSRDLLVKQWSALCLREQTGAIARLDFHEWVLEERLIKSSMKRSLLQTNYI